MKFATQRTSQLSTLGDFMLNQFHFPSTPLPDLQSSGWPDNDGLPDLGYQYPLQDCLCLGFVDNRWHICWIKQKIDWRFGAETLTSMP
ncbi:MAG TPA: hypothetical protein VMV89_01195 [Candidatus Paceibacterota bacterium]|nr:hypothetical protein [Candidatus Paceibacterota bacterium]